MSKLLIDTSVIIDFLRRKDKKDTLLYQISGNDLYISIITHAELYSGKGVWEKQNVKEALENVLEEISIIPLNEKMSQKSGHLKAQYYNTSLFDCIIAATASSNDIKLVTFNTKDFKNIKGLTLFELN